MEPWRTAISDSDATHMWMVGYDVTELMTRATFADVVFLLHKGRLASEGERRLIDAMLVASADHGPASPSATSARTVASGNRVAPEAAIAAGVLAIGDAHGGAGLACLELIEKSLARAQREGLTTAVVAQRVVEEARAAGERLPGIGHRVHSETDPRTAVLFELATRFQLAGRGIEFMNEVGRAVAAAIKPLSINIDGAMAAILYDLGFPPLVGKLFFIIGRVAGLSAEVMEEYTREQPMRIKVPVVYDGPPPRSMP